MEIFFSVTKPTKQGQASHLMHTLLFLHKQVHVQFKTKVAIPFCKNDKFLYLYHIQLYLIVSLTQYLFYLYYFHLLYALLLQIL